MKSPLRITYLLPAPELNGGNKVIFQHAELLRGAGHLVNAVADGSRPDWIPYRGAYRDLSTTGDPAKPNSPPPLPEQDLVIATYWTTVRPALAAGWGPVAHFCQGYEGDLEHLRPVVGEIEAVYAERLPTLTVTPHLAALLGSRFGREARVVPPPLDPLFRPSHLPRWRPRRVPWIALPGIFESEVKGTRTALAALQRLRAAGLRFRVLRFSTLPLSAAELELHTPDRFLFGAAPSLVAAALRVCDLLLLPSLAAEGFGLPLLEAMTSGVPAVAARIPATEFITAGEGVLVPAEDAAAMAVAAQSLLEDPRRWRAARRTGLRQARRFRSEAVLPSLLDAVEWASGWAEKAAGTLPPAWARA